MFINLVFVFQYVLSVLKFTYPTLFQGWQTLVGGFLLHVSWKLGWVEISCSSRSEVLTWLPASALFVGIIYAGSRALSRLVRNTPVEMNNQILCLCFLSHSVLFLLIAAGCLPFFDTQFDPDGYFWALIHLICVGKKPVNFPLSVLLCSSGDLFSALDFPFLYFYRFHSSCCASGLLGFFLMLHTVKLKSITSSWQYAAWSFLAKVRERPSAELGRSVSPGCLDFGALFRASSRYSLHKIWSCHCPWSFTSLHC
uniref:Transmembrane protein 241 n=1 Tax=Chelonoidis abingdonii TaxID=106734 RepID=A0A8C0GBF4_CHEAB